jgi:hypothetical protein
VAVWLGAVATDMKAYSGMTIQVRNMASRGVQPAFQLM